MTGARLTDAVVEAARRGDADAFRTVYAELAGGVQQYLRAKGIREAEDVTSEVFLALFRTIRTVTGGAVGLRRVTFTIARARVADHYRATAARAPQQPYDVDEDPRSTPSAEAVATGGDDGSVHEVLRRLPEEYREVLVLRFAADLSIDQVAVLMKRSTGAVKQLQRRAIIAAQQLLHEPAARSAAAAGRTLSTAARNPHAADRDVLDGDGGM